MNGAPIFEGDILLNEDDGEYHQVTWNKEKAKFEWGKNYGMDENFDSLIVVGNIHENEDLLK